MARIKPRIALGLHAHQPAGNFDNIFAAISNESYLPFLKEYNRRKDVGKISYHASGILLEWWEKNMPEMIDLLGSLIEDGKIEMLGGGYYEPILPLIPPEDQKLQVEKLLDYIENLFSRRPEGIWLTERIWSPELPATLADIGIKYTIVDDFHFHAAGWQREELNGYYMTEYNRKKIGIFPISQQLRYRIPFHDVERIEKYLDTGKENTVWTMADDAEKFGSWPETSQWVYEDGWLERFFDACEKGSINICSLGEVFNSQDPTGHCYLPTASYEEMLEWALPAQRLAEYENWKNNNEENAEKFGRGGYFHNFLVKYPESNRLHKKMQWLSHNIDKKENEVALEHLLAGQCNDTYWHGVFGGLCLPHLRGEAWRNLSAATAQIKPADSYPLLEDYNCDGLEEVLYHSDSQFLIIDPHNGGEMLCWELLAAQRNVLDSLSRRWEPYLEAESETANDKDSDVDTIHHRKTQVPGEWLQSWAADPVVRAGFQVVTFNGEPDSTGLEQNEGINYELRGDKPLDTVFGQNKIGFDYNAAIKRIRYTFLDNGLTWQAEAAEEIENWGMVLNLGFRTPEKDYCRMLINENSYTVLEKYSGELESLLLIDELAGYQIEITPRSPLQLITYPIETISRSEGGAEKIYQGTALVFASTAPNINLTLDCSGGKKDA